jgi:hypothetical protein
MDWKRERDALIAQTDAFVQSVAGKKEASDRAVEARLDGRLPPVMPPQPSLQASAAPFEAAPASVSPIQSLTSQSLSPQSSPKESLPIASPRPNEPPRLTPPVPLGIQDEVKIEIQARIANFRAHQDRFNRERDEYFSATWAKLRTALAESTPRRSG